MGLFSFGASSSKSKSESQSTSGSSSDAYNVGSSRQGSQSSQDIAFKDMFAKLYGGAAAAAGGMSGMPIKSAADMLFSGGVGFLNQLEGGEGDAYLANRIKGESPVLQEQISALGDDLGAFFRDELNPAITSQAVGGGALGGGRQGVAQGIASKEVATQFARGATALRSEDIKARDAAARDLTGLRTAAAGTGLAALPGMLGVASTGALADLAPFQALSQIFGGPTVVGQSSSYGESTNVGKSVSDSFSQSTSSSKGKSKSGSIGFG
jgi:hypothetical protein